MAAGFVHALEALKVNKVSVKNKEACSCGTSPKQRLLQGIRMYLMTLPFVVSFSKMESWSHIVIESSQSTGSLLKIYVFRSQC